jgi:HAD superfamily hydrolase (TIGR01459 family)
MTNASAIIPIIETVAPLTQTRDAWLLDIWGVLHNGMSPFPDAVAACQTFRQRGGIVLLVSNSPRTCTGVATQLAAIGVPEDCYDGIATSGDVTRHLIAKHAGKTIFHIGPERDLLIFDGLNVTLGEPDDAAAIVCTGLYNDETETPDDYAALFGALRALNLPMICANPDMACERGNRIIPCAGALASAYEALGGEVLLAGKPYRPIYDLALAHIAEIRGAEVPKERLLAIGDGVPTDIAGAGALGVDSVFVASRVFVTRADGVGLTSAVVAELFEHQEARPIAATDRLVW